MLFQKRFWAGIQDGSITLTFRRWKRRQVLGGRRYRTPAGIIEVEAIAEVLERDITDAEAMAAGHPDAATLVADLPERPGLPLFRIAFHYVDEPDPRAELAADDRLTAADVAEIDRRLDRLDKASRHGPWTAAVLDVIRDRPETRAAELAEGFGRDLQPFKADVRKLKNLGLTISLRPGYRLSPRGVAYLRAKGR